MLLCLLALLMTMVKANCFYPEFQQYSTNDDYALLKTQYQKMFQVSNIKTCQSGGFLTAIQFTMVKFDHFGSVESTLSLGLNGDSSATGCTDTVLVDGLGTDLGFITQVRRATDGFGRVYFLAILTTNILNEIVLMGTDLGVTADEKIEYFTANSPVMGSYVAFDGTYVTNLGFYYHDCGTCYFTKEVEPVQVIPTFQTTVLRESPETFIYQEIQDTVSVNFGSLKYCGPKEMFIVYASDGTTLIPTEVPDSKFLNAQNRPYLVQLDVDTNTITVNTEHNEDIGQYSYWLVARFTDYDLDVPLPFDVIIEPCVITSFNLAKPVPTRVDYEIMSGIIELNYQYVQTPLCNYTQTTTAEPLKGFQKLNGASLGEKAILIYTENMQFDGLYVTNFLEKCDDEFLTSRNFRITFNLINPCTLTSIESKVIFDMKQMTIADKKISQNIGAFTDTTSTKYEKQLCGSFFVQLVGYNTIKKEADGRPPGFVSFEKNIIYVDTVDDTQIGEYDLAIYASLPTYRGIEEYYPFKVEIVGSEGLSQKDLLTKPYLEIAPRTQTVQIGSAWEYQLAPVLSKSSKVDVTKIQITVQMPTAENFLQFIPSTMASTFRIAEGASTLWDNGSHKVFITLTDENGASIEYIWTIIMQEKVEVIEEVKEEVVEEVIQVNENGYIFAQIQEISPFGELVLLFSEPLYLEEIILVNTTDDVWIYEEVNEEELDLENSSNETNPERLLYINKYYKNDLIDISLDVDQDDIGSSFPEIIDWYITYFYGNRLEIQLIFSHTKWVSSHLPFDNLHIKFLQPELFMNLPRDRADEARSIYPFTDLIKDMPSQVTSEQYYWLDSIGYANQGIVILALFFNFVANILFKGHHLYFWQNFLAFQLIMHQLLINVNMPANAQIVFSYMMPVAKLDLLTNKSINEMYRSMFFQTSETQLQQIPVAFLNLDYPSSVFFHNSGASLILLSLILYPLICVLSCRCKSWGEQYQYVTEWMYRQLYFDYVVRAFTIGYMVWATSVMISLRYERQIDDTNKLNQVSRVLNYITLVILIVIPIGLFVSYFVWYKFLDTKIEQKEEEPQISSLKDKETQQVDEENQKQRKIEDDKNKDETKPTDEIQEKQQKKPMEKKQSKFWKRCGLHMQGQILKRRSRLSISMNPVFFYLKRFIIAYIVVFERNPIQLQIFYLFMISIFWGFLDEIVNHYSRRLQRKLQKIHQFVTLTIFYHLILFTDYIYDAETKFLIGYSLITFVSFVCLIISISAMLESFIMMIRSIKLRYAQDKALRSRVQMERAQRYKSLMILDQKRQQQREAEELHEQIRQQKEYDELQRRKAEEEKQSSESSRVSHEDDSDYTWETVSSEDENEENIKRFREELDKNCQSISSSQSFQDVDRPMHLIQYDHDPNDKISLTKTKKKRRVRKRKNKRRDSKMSKASDINSQIENSDDEVLVKNPITVMNDGTIIEHLDGHNEKDVDEGLDITLPPAYGMIKASQLKDMPSIINEKDKHNYYYNNHIKSQNDYGSNSNSQFNKSMTTFNPNNDSFIQQKSFLQSEFKQTQQESRPASQQFKIPNRQQTQISQTSTKPPKKKSKQKNSKNNLNKSTSSFQSTKKELKKPTQVSVSSVLKAPPPPPATTTYLDMLPKTNKQVGISAADALAQLKSEAMKSNQSFQSFATYK